MVIIVFYSGRKNFFDENSSTSNFYVYLSSLMLLPSLTIDNNINSHVTLLSLTVNCIEIIFESR